MFPSIYLTYLDPNLSGIRFSKFVPWQRSPSIFSAGVPGGIGLWPRTVARLGFWGTLCYAAAMPLLCLPVPAFLILLLFLFCFQLSLDVTHLPATAAGHCGGHGAHVDAERTANGSCTLGNPPQLQFPAVMQGYAGCFSDFLFIDLFFSFLCHLERKLLADMRHTDLRERDQKSPKPRVD